MYISIYNVIMTYRNTCGQGSYIAFASASLEEAQDYIGSELSSIREYGLGDDYLQKENETVCFDLDGEPLRVVGSMNNPGILFREMEVSAWYAPEDEDSDGSEAESFVNYRIDETQIALRDDLYVRKGGKMIPFGKLVDNDDSETISGKYESEWEDEDD